MKPYQIAAQSHRSVDRPLQQSVLSKSVLVQLKSELQKSPWDEGTILKYMERDDVVATTYNLSTAIATLHVWSHRPNTEQVAKEVENLLLWLGTPPGFTVFLWLQDIPRRITADEWPSRRSVNGGWTIPHSNSIYVYREEEWDRVLIHESIHALGWDWDMATTSLPCWGVQGTFAPHLFEAWTECYAEWLYCAWHAIPWETQMAHQKAQALQVLARAKPIWNENTNVYAYYVLKAALAPHIAFLLPFQTGKTTDEKLFVLCNLVAEPLRLMTEEAKTVIPKSISMRMSVKK